MYSCYVTYNNIYNYANAVYASVNCDSPPTCLYTFTTFYRCSTERWSCLVANDAEEKKQVKFSHFDSIQFFVYIETSKACTMHIKSQQPLHTTHHYIQMDRADLNLYTTTQLYNTRTPTYGWEKWRDSICRTMTEPSIYVRWCMKFYDNLNHS